LLPNFYCIYDPVKDYRINLFTKITADDEKKIVEYLGQQKQESPSTSSVSITPTVPEEIQGILNKATETDDSQVECIISFSQNVLRYLAYQQTQAWENLFGDLPEPIVSLETEENMNENQFITNESK